MYELVFAGSKVEVKTRKDPWYLPLHKPPWMGDLSLLGSCRQISHEALPVAYAACTFIVDRIRGEKVDLQGKHMHRLRYLVVSLETFDRPFEPWETSLSGRHIPDLIHVEVRLHEYDMVAEDFVRERIRLYFGESELSVTFCTRPPKG